MSRRPSVSLLTPSIPRTLAAARGARIGRQLAGDASAAMLMRFYEWPPNNGGSAWSAAWAVLLQTLGQAAQQPKVRDALMALDAAHGNDSADRIDEAWYASWTAAHRLAGRSAIR